MVGPGRALAFSDPAAAPGAVDALTSNHPWPSQQFTNFNTETKQGISFISREGIELP
jgi:hypothetical protein